MQIVMRLNRIIRFIIQYNGLLYRMIFILELHVHLILSMSIICPLCNRNGFSLEVLIEHIEEKYILENYSVLCPICFKRQNYLLEHLKQHTNENQSKVVLVSQRSLLKKFLPNNSNKIDTQHRNLLTDLLNS